MIGALLTDQVCKIYVLMVEIIDYSLSKAFDFRFSLTDMPLMQCNLFASRKLGLMQLIIIGLKKLLLYN